MYIFCMGINDLWSVLSPGFDERIAFPIWVSNFVAENGRPPKLAIDGFMFLFQSKHSGITDWTNELIIHNFISKLVYFSSLNVSYIVVFDGNDKPFKANRSNVVGTDIESLNQLGCTSPFEDNLILELKKALVKYSISFIQCPGEGEAECAMLQKTNIVDYIVSNDVDSLVFGTTKMLRNFSRFKEDKPASGVGSSGSGEFYVTPVCMRNVVDKTGLDYTRLLLIATIRGGDYSNGVEKIGITRAVKLALCGTPFASYYHRSPSKAELKEQKKASSLSSSSLVSRSDPLPDFSRLLLDCFVDPFAPKKIRPEAQRNERLVKFLELLNESVLVRSREIFERKTVIENLSIDESYTLMYLFPKVSLGRFDFKRDKYNFGAEIMNQVIPMEEFSFNIKYLILKLLSHFERIKELAEYIRATRTKVVNGCQFVMIRYNAEKIHDLIFPRLEMSQESIVDDDEPEVEDKVVEKSVWIPGNLIELVNPEILSKYQIELEKKKEQKKVSPRRKPLQKTTLDMLVRRQLSLIENQNVIQSDIELPIKKDELVHECKINEKKEERGISLGLALFPRASPKRSPVRKKRSPKKKTLLPGQSLVTSFFSGKKEEKPDIVDVSVEMDPPIPSDNPFLTAQSLFLDSDSDSEVLRPPHSAPELSFRVPTLPPPKREISSSGLAETSPTKKHHLQLSPNNSPDKVDKFPTIDVSPLKKP